jgi:hypothetical protein
MFNEYPKTQTIKRLMSLFFRCRCVVPPSSERGAESASHRSASSFAAPRGTCGRPSMRNAISANGPYLRGRKSGRRGDGVGGFGVAIVDCGLSSSCRANVPCRYLACIGGVPLLVVESNLQPARYTMRFCWCAPSTLASDGKSAPSRFRVRARVCRASVRMRQASRL